MKYFIVALACIAGAAAQFLDGSPFGGRNYKQYNQYNQFSQYSQYKQPQQYRYQPQYYSTPRPVVSVTPVYQPVVTAAPTPVPVVARVAYNGDARSANIVKQGNEINPDGAYSYYYETDNGIAAQEQGAPRVANGESPIVAQGSFSWTSPEGEPIAITYTADENGYHPEGRAIPVAPEVPAQIARALAYTAKYIADKQ